METSAANTASPIKSKPPTKVEAEKEEKLQYFKNKRLHFKLLSYTDPERREKYPGPITQKALGLWWMCKHAQKDKYKAIVGGFDTTLNDTFVGIFTNMHMNGKPGWPAVCKNCKHPGHVKLHSDSAICNCGHFHSPDKTKPGVWLVCEAEVELGVTCGCVRFTESGKCSSCKCDDYEYEPQFARGCPTRPRHGFVESRLVADLAETKKVFAEAITADPDAELILMPFVKAVCSAIYIPESGSIAVGEGHDGATGGHSSLVIPVNTMTIDPEVRKGAGIAEGEHMYLELVCSGIDKSVQNKQGSKNVRLVQARSGPPREMGINEFVPKRMKIERILRPTDDLLAWEVLTAQLKGLPGIVAWQPEGNLFDHAAIHASANGLAFLTRKEPPRLGDMITPPEVVKPPLSVSDIWKGASAKIEDRSEDLAMAIGFIHNYVQFVYSNQQGVCMGYALGQVFRMAALACIGELRHNRKDEEGKNKVSWKLPNRQEVYNKHNNDSLPALADHLARRVIEFIWRGSFPDGYGGWKWFACGVQATKLYNLMSEIKDKESMDTAVTEANKLLHMAHNNGWLFNKFLVDGEMDKAAANPGLYMSTRIAKLWNVLKLRNKKSIKALPVRTVRYFDEWGVKASSIAESGLITIQSSKGPLIPRAMDENTKQLFKDCNEHV